MAVGAAGIAATGSVLGCGKEPEDTPPKGADENAKPSFEVPPDPIPEEDIKETVTTDVVVCGAGISECVRCSCRQRGSKVSAGKGATSSFRG